jgi:hypothetical protein
MPLLSPGSLTFTSLCHPTVITYIYPFSYCMFVCSFLSIYFIYLLCFNLICSMCCIFFFLAAYLFIYFIVI